MLIKDDDDVNNEDDNDDDDSWFRTGAQVIPTCWRRRRASESGRLTGNEVDEDDVAHLSASVPSPSSSSLHSLASDILLV